MFSPTHPEPVGARTSKARARGAFASTPQELHRLQTLTNHDDARLSARARIIVAGLQGKNTAEIARELDVSLLTVYKWRRRYREHGDAGLHDLPRIGQPRKLSDAAQRELVEITRHTLPPDAAVWSIRRLAATMNVTAHQVRRAWDEAGIAAYAFRGRGALDGLLCEFPAAELLGVCMSPPYNAFVLAQPSAISPGLLRQSRAVAESLNAQRARPGSVWRAFEVSGGRLDQRVRHSPSVLQHFVDALPTHAAPGARVVLAVSTPASLEQPAIASRVREWPSARTQAIEPAATWLCVLDGWLRARERGRAQHTVRDSVWEVRQALMQHAVASPGQAFVWHRR